MKLLLVIFFATALLALPTAQTLPQPGKAKPAVAVSQRHQKPASRSGALQQGKAGHAGKTNVRRVVVTRMVNGRLVRVSRVVHTRKGPIVPAHPDPDRLKEIQKALAEKGYFKGEPDGEWNADSVAALKQFQTDNKLTADGKINALSLIGLGLGPKHEGNAAIAPPVQPEQSTPP